MKLRVRQNLVKFIQFIDDENVMIWTQNMMRLNFCFSCVASLFRNFTLRFKIERCKF